MLFIIQLIYIQPDCENVFLEFEQKAIPIIGKYNGQLLLRIRPDDHTVVEHTIEKPYEIHLVQFLTASDFENFKQDEERKQFLHLKEQSVRETILIRGTAI